MSGLLSEPLVNCSHRRLRNSPSLDEPFCHLSQTGPPLCSIVNDLPSFSAHPVSTNLCSLLLIQRLRLSKPDYQAAEAIQSDDGPAGLHHFCVDEVQAEVIANKQKSVFRQIR